jgi:hypothetical protein
LAAASTSTARSTGVPSTPSTIQMEVQSEEEFEEEGEGMDEEAGDFFDAE